MIIAFEVVRIILSIIGIIGNAALMVAIFQNPLRRLKSFEVFLLGLALANLEMIIIVDTYDTVMILYPWVLVPWTCRSLKFLTLLGEIASILFTVLISIYRYQKLRDAGKTSPIYLDNVRSAWLVSGLCVGFSALLSFPTYVLDLDGHMENLTQNCPPDFFQCHKDNCPFLNRFYKYLFIFVCNLVPLFIVTVTGCFIIKILVDQKKKVVPALTGSGFVQPGKKSKGADKFHRSTVAILSAMGVFQVDWTVYLILHLATSPDDFPMWSEFEFFITTCYTTISPYVYGIGNNFFSMKHFNKHKK